MHVSPLTRLSTSQGLIVSLLPALTVFAEFFFRFHPLVQLAYLYLLACVAWSALRTYRRTLRRGHAGSVRVAHVLLLALFALTLFGVLPLLRGFAGGTWLPQIVLPLDQDVIYYGLTFVLWLALYNFTYRLPHTNFDHNLRPRFSLWDIPIFIGIAGATWLILGLYLRKLGFEHQRMEIFGVDLTGQPLYLYYLVGAVFTLANALAEELWWRGTLLGALRPLLRPAAAILLQGLCFGLFHWFGTPQGILGLVLAGAWGCALGWWAYARRSIWQPLIVHLLADWLIFVYTN